MRASSPNTSLHSDAAVATAAQISTSDSAVTFKNVLKIDDSWFQDIPDPPDPNLNNVADLLDLDNVTIVSERATLSPISLKKDSVREVAAPFSFHSMGNSTLKRSSFTPIDTTNDTSVFVPPSSRYLSTPRSEFDTSTKCVVSKERRPASGSDLRKLRDLATQPLTNKFAKVPLDDSEYQILNNYNLTMRVKELKRALERYDIDDIFNIVQFPHETNIDQSLTTSIPIQPSSRTINLLDNWDQVQEIDVIRHVQFLRLYGQQWDLENLDWSLDTLESSCETDLANKVQEDMIALSTELESGPMFFFYMMREIISSTEDAVTSMIERIQHMKLTNFKGENVSVATGQLRMAILRLEVLGKIPIDINKNVLDVLQTSSVTKFNLFFHQLQINLKQIPSFDMTTFKILTMADSTYREYLEIGIWSSAKSTTGGSGAFMLDDSKEVNSGDKGALLLDDTKKVNWKVIKPRDGEKEAKVTGGRSWWWCAKCRRWTPTHSTATHRKKGTLTGDGDQTSNSGASNGSVTTATTSDNSSLAITDASSLTNPSMNFTQYDLGSIQNSRRSLFRNNFKLSE